MQENWKKESFIYLSSGIENVKICRLMVKCDEEIQRPGIQTYRKGKHPWM